MKKIEIVTRIADETGLTKVQAEKIVNAILEEIKLMFKGLRRPRLEF